MPREFFRILSRNRASTTSTIRRHHSRALSLETLDGRVLLSSVPGGGTFGPLALVQTPRTPLMDAKTSDAGILESAALTSSNWSGYVAETNLNDPQTNSVTAVAGSWVVPSVTGPQGASSYSSVWVGIDGANGNNTVEQVGTEQDVVDGVPIYYAWWEMYSTGAQQPQQVFTGMTVRPGDLVQASVQFISTGLFAGDFELGITDTSRPNDSFAAVASPATTQNPRPLRNSAEWIVENPKESGSVRELANFGDVTFSDAAATINGITGGINSPARQSTQLNMVSNGVTEASTSALPNPTGPNASFSVSFALESAVDCEGVLYALQNGTLYSSPAGQSDWSPVTDDVLSIAAGGDGGLYILYTNDTVDRYVYGRVPTSVDPTGTATALVAGGDGGIYILHANSLYRYYYGAGGLSPIEVTGQDRAVVAGGDGGIYVLHANDTVSRYYYGQGWTSVDPTGQATALVAGGDGGIYILHANSLYRYYYGAGGLSPIEVTGQDRAIAAGGDGGVYVLHANDTVNRYYYGQGWTTVDPTGQATALVAGGDGGIYILHANSLYRYYYGAGGLSPIEVTGQDRAIAAGGDGGVYVLHSNDTLGRYYYGQGWSPVDSTGDVLSMAAGGDGGIYILHAGGTVDRHIYGQNPTPVDSSGSVETIVAGGDGGIYLLRSDGSVYRFASYLGEQMESPSGNSGGVSAIAAGGDGGVYFLYNSGVVDRVVWAFTDNAADNGRVTTMVSGGDGGIYLLHPGGSVSRYVSYLGDQLETLFGVSTIAAGGDGGVYFLYHSGVVDRVVWAFSGNQADSGPVTTMVSGGDGGIYLLHSDGSVYRYVSYLGKQLESPSGNSGGVRALAAGGDGGVYFLYNDGSFVNPRRLGPFPATKLTAVRSRRWPAVATAESTYCIPTEASAGTFGAPVSRRCPSAGCMPLPLRAMGASTCSRPTAFWPATPGAWAKKRSLILTPPVIQSQFQSAVTV